MQAVILAGGRATRLGVLTNSMPKSMIPIGDKPFLLYILHNYIHQGIKHFVICTGYMSEKIEIYFQDGKNFGCHISYSREESPLGTGGALRLAASLLEDEFLLLNGDNLNFMDTENFIRFFEECESIVTMAVYRNLCTDRYKNNIAYDSSRHMVTDYQWPSSEKMQFVDTGVRCVRKEILSYFPDTPVFSIEKDVFTVLAQKGEISGYQIEKQPLDIGTLENISITKQILTNKGYA